MLGALGEFDVIKFVFEEVLTSDKLCAKARLYVSSICFLLDHFSMGPSNVCHCQENSWCMMCAFVGLFFLQFFH